MSNLLGTSFAKSGFSWDPNISPNNQSFRAAVRAVDAAGGFVLAPPGPTINGTTITLNGTLVVNGTSTFNGNVVIVGTGAGPTLTVGSGVRQELTVQVVSGMNNAAVLVLGTGTALNWGGAFGPALQFSQASAIWQVAGEESVPTLYTMVGVYYNGTNYIFTGTATSGQNANVSVFGQGLRIYNLGTGTRGGTGTLTQIFDLDTGNKVAPILRVYGPTAATLVDMTPDRGTFVGTYVGVSNTTTATCVWARYGNIVVLSLNSPNTLLTGTSNSTSFSMTGVPPAITPGMTQASTAGFLRDNGSDAAGVIAMLSNSTILFYKNIPGTQAGWTASGQKGLDGVQTITYQLNTS